MWHLLKTEIQTSNFLAQILPAAGICSFFMFADLNDNPMFIPYIYILLGIIFPWVPAFNKYRILASRLPISLKQLALVRLCQLTLQQLAFWSAICIAYAVWTLSGHPSTHLMMSMALLLCVLPGANACALIFQDIRYIYKGITARWMSYILSVMLSILALIYTLMVTMGTKSGQQTKIFNTIKTAFSDPLVISMVLTVSILLVWINTLTYSKRKTFQN